MRRIFAAFAGIWLALAPCAEIRAQSINDIFNASAAGGGGYVGPLDLTLSGTGVTAVHWYGPRCGSVTYTGNVMDVTNNANSAGGSATLETMIRCVSGVLTVTSGGCINPSGVAVCSALAVTCAAHCYLNIKYDQVGTAHQSFVTAPELLGKIAGVALGAGACGNSNGQLCLNYTTGDFIRVLSAPALSAPLMMYAYADIGTSSPATSVVASHLAAAGGFNGHYLQLANSSGTITLTFDSVAASNFAAGCCPAGPATFTANTGQRLFGGGALSTSSRYAYIGGTAGAQGTLTSAPTTQNDFGEGGYANSGSNPAYIGQVTDVGYWSATSISQAQIASNFAAICANENAYYGGTNFC